MKTAPAGVISYVNANNVGFRADLFTFSLAAGVFRWTTCDADLTVGSDTWVSNMAVLGRSSTRQATRLEVDALTVDLSGEVQIAGKSIALLALQGYFDEGRLRVDHLVGADAASALALGPVKACYEGRIAGVDPTPLGARIGVLNDLESLQDLLLPRFKFGLACQHAVYDANCTMDKGTFTLAGTVSGLPTTTAVPTATAAISAKPSGYFNLGMIRFNSGALTGTRRSIATWDGTTFTLALPLPSVPEVGAAFSVYPGCARTQLDCGPVGSGGKFNNLVSFRGFPHIPEPAGGK